MTKQIKLTQNKSAIVDADMYEYLMQWKWCYNGRYATRIENYYKPCGKRTTRAILLHRVINNTPDGLDTDHINGDKLDNRKSNLRNCTKSENMMNRKSNKNSTSEYKGIYWNKRKNKWHAQIKINKKGKYLGLFNCEIEAAKTYNKAAIEYFGKFAQLNITTQRRLNNDTIR